MLKRSIAQRVRGILERLTPASREQARISAFFDAKWYAERYPEVKLSGLRPREHFIRTGARMRYDPHPLFSTDWYLSTYPNPAASGINPLLHYLEHGAFHHFDPHPLFASDWYLRMHPEVRAAKINPLEHYIRTGAGLGFDPHPMFDASLYLEKNPVDASARANPLRHFLEMGWRQDFVTHALFNPAWYRAQYPDITDHMNALCHFLHHGWKERRDPCEFFSTGWYADQYPDVIAAGRNPILHYLQDGAAEGRHASPEFDTGWYLTRYPDVKANGINPLVHFVKHGIGEARNSSPPRKPVRLRSDFGVEDAEFQRWRRTVLMASQSPIAEDWRVGATNGAGRREQPARRIFTFIGKGVSTDASDLTQISFIDSMEALGIERHFPPAGTIADLRGDRISDGDFVIFAKQGDRIDSSGLRKLIGCLGGKTKLCIFDLYYSNGEIYYPVLHPGANPEYLRGMDSCFSRFAIAGDMLRRVMSDPAIRNEREILLSALAMITRDSDWDALVHCPGPILETPCLDAEIQNMRRSELQRRSREAHLPAAAVDGLVSVIICTKDKGHLVEQLVRNLLDHCDSLIADIVIVANQMSNVFALLTLERWRRHPKVIVKHYDDSFNFSAQSNLGAKASSGDFLLFLNDDIVPVTVDWLRRLRAPFADPTVGATGPLLIYPDERVQHAAMFLGFRGAAGHTLRGAKLPDQDYIFTGAAGRDVSCVTGAALLMRRSCFEDLNGFDDQLLSILQDVDLCLRVSNLGLRILYVPQAVLIHMESVTLVDSLEKRGFNEQRGREYGYFCTRHSPEILQNDRFLNPCHDITDETLRTLTC